MNIHIIRTDGREEHVDAPFDKVNELIGAPGSPVPCLGTVNLRDGRVMMLNDRGYETKEETVTVEGTKFVRIIPVKALLPDNAKATALYHSVCRLGTTHRVVGDVAIVVDAEVPVPEWP